MYSSSQRSSAFSYQILPVDVNYLVKKYKLSISPHFEHTELEEFLKQFDPLDLLTDTKDADNDLVAYELENNVLVTFLEKNDARSLIGIKSRYFKNESLFKVDASVVKKKIFEIKPIRTSSLYGIRRNNQDFLINMKTKSKLAELYVIDLEKRVAEMEKESELELRNLRSHAEELKLRAAEAEAALKNFSLYFVDKEEDRYFIEKAQPILVFKKWQKYFQNWKEKSSGLLHLISLKMSSLRASCNTMQANIHTRAEVSTYTKEIDFDNLLIIRRKMLAKLDDLLGKIKGLEFSNMKSTHSFSDAIKTLKKGEFSLKDLVVKCNELERRSVRMDKEIDQIETKNDKDKRVLRSMERRNRRFIAPNINEYMDKKNELAAAIKEEKILNRKVNILNMKLINLKRKLLKFKEPRSKRIKITKHQD